MLTVLTKSLGKEKSEKAVVLIIQHSAVESAGLVILVEVHVNIFDAPSVVAIQLAAAPVPIVPETLSLPEFVPDVPAAIAFDMPVFAEVMLAAPAAPAASHTVFFADLTVWLVVPELEIADQPHVEN